MDPAPTFWCEPTGRIRRYLRCYQSRSKVKFPGSTAPGVMQRASHPPPPCRVGDYAYCNAMRVLDEVEKEFEEHDGKRYSKNYDPKLWPWDAFPLKCESCGEDMDAPERQIFTDDIMVVKTGPRAGHEFARRDLPVGAMFEIEHYREFKDWCGWDGIAVCVMCPGGEWHVDGRASNCTKPDDRQHRCWVRHGDPRTGYLHVDKAGTGELPPCDAGAGSIWQHKDAGPPREWHGHAYRGFLIDCGGQGTVDAMLDLREPPNPIAPAERALPVHRRDRPVTVRPVVPPPVPGQKPTWRANRSRHAGRLKR